MSAVEAPSQAKRLAPALADAISQCMRDDPRVIVWGEDVRIGVMGPTRGLADEFGPERVVDCPISEAAFVGAAVGAAVGGLRPVVDIMFSSFAYVAFDQLVNQAGRLRYMTGGQLAVPLVVVGSAGAAGSNAAQHSEVPSALFLQAGGLRVVFPSTPHQAFWLMRAAIESEDPVVVLHHPALAAARGSVSPEPLGLGEAQVDPVGTDVSVFATGMMAHRARAAARSLGAEGISVEVVDVCSLSPMPWDAILASVGKTGRAVVVDEGRLTCSVSSEIAAGLAERAFGALRTGIRRLAVPDVPIPFAPNLEQAVIPRPTSRPRYGRPSVADTTPIVLPKAGMNMVEATVVAWRKSPGEQVEKGEPVVAVETDKVELEIEAPVSGVLQEVLVAVDEDALVGATLGLIEPAS